MTREEISGLVNLNKHKSYLLQLGTSYGKTKVALDAIFAIAKPDAKILIVCPYHTIIKNWKEEEMPKWGYNKWIDKVVFSTYKSLYKQADIKWDFIICDEVHHLSERCRDALNCIKTNYFIGLSATVKRDLVWYLKMRFKGIQAIKADINDAIKSDVLAEPIIYLYPIKLDNSISNCLFECNKKAKGKAILVEYRNRFKYRSYKGKYNIKCTQQQYYNELSGLIDFYKRKSTGSIIMKNMWLSKAGERLKWLAGLKHNIIKNIIKKVGKNRSLIFCANIEQSEKLGIPCVNSKIGLENLDKFNSKKINSIAAVAMLDEGVSLSDCRISVFQMISSSTRMLLQRFGRAMRHNSPIIMFPYFENTREEEIINKEIISNYSEAKIIKLNSIKDIKL